MILVTGAAGHLGNVLVRELILQGEQVRALVLPGENIKALNGLDIEIVEGNICKEDTLVPIFNGVTEVYHLAALVSIIPGQEKLLRQINVEGTKNMLKVAKQAGVRRFVYTSSIHAITRPPEGTTIDEGLTFDKNNLAGAYDRTKAEASLAVLDSVKGGLDAVIVCPTGVIGPHDYRRSEMGELILEWMAKKLSILTDGFFDFVDVRDVARGHILACEKGKKGETYILAGERIELVKMCRMVKEITQSKSPVVKIPFPLAIFATNFSQIYYRLTRTRPKFTRYALETVASNSSISDAKARRELGYKPRSIQVTLNDTVKWWLKNREQTKASLRI